MKMINYVLISDGSSDRCLMPIIEFAISKHLKFASNGEWANFNELPISPKNLIDKIIYCNSNYEVDLFFIHRDGEKDANPLIKRCQEIENAINESGCDLKHIACIPIRMTEAWLLFDEKAIRYASSNPNGKVKLNLPDIKKLENIPDPKKVLKEKLILASELSGRRLKKFNTSQKIHLVSKHIEDYSKLEKLKSYTHFIDQLKQLKNNIG